MRRFEKYCDDFENIENYEKAKADNFIGWECHHRLETHNSDGERRLVDISHKELIALGMYYHRPANELIFLTITEHRFYRKGKHRSEETRRKLSESHKGQVAWNKGKPSPYKGVPRSEETKKKITESLKGRQLSEETKQKLSEINKGKHLSEETKKKISEAGKGENNPNFGKRWFNNGKINVMCYECPDGFKPGRIYHRGK